MTIQMSEQDRRLAAARVSAFITAPSWARSPYAGEQAKQILALVLDTKSCAATMDHPYLPNQQAVCFREKGHDYSHISDGDYAWDLTDEELEARHDAKVDRDIAEHEQMLHDTLEDR